MKKVFIAMALIAIIGIIVGITACDDGSNNDNNDVVVVQNSTPVETDFNIVGTGTFTYDGNPKVVTVTAREGKTGGTITVKYNGETTAPSVVNTYTVTFDVTAAEGWSAASGLNAGTLTITSIPITYSVNFDSNGGSDIDSRTGLNSGDTITEPTAPTKPGYKSKFVGWYDQSLEHKFDFNTPITDNIMLYAKWEPQYQPGDTCPGGGIIFYCSEEGFTMIDNNETCHYLSAAPADSEETMLWASLEYIYIYIDNTGTDIGTGRNNTILILDTDINAPVAKYCDELIVNGFDDWFLPSRDELNQLFLQKELIDNINTQTYFSSSQSDYDVNNSAVWIQDFSDPDGKQYNNVTKENLLYVRAIRAF